MLFIISPAKSLDFDVKNIPKNISNPQFLTKSESLIKELRKLSCNDLSKLMKISAKLADLNFNRYQDFSVPFNINNSKPALFVFNGDVYSGIDEKNYDEEDLEFAQNNLRILSGLYGVLRPLDLIQAYRLEMGVNLKNNSNKNLYEFWKTDIANYFNQELLKRDEKLIVNLASNEYSSVIDKNLLNGKLLNIIFKNNKNGVYKNIGIFAKKARGLMANFIIKDKVITAEGLKLFNKAGYQFKEEFSDELNWHFYSNG